jgi:hypothetical protein
MKHSLVVARNKHTTKQEIAANMSRELASRIFF